MRRRLQFGLSEQAGDLGTAGTNVHAEDSIPSHKERDVMASEKNLQELFHETLKDIYLAENKIIKTLPKLAKAWERT